jgi:integrase
MGRKSAYEVRLPDGREIGFGLLQREDSAIYSVQFLAPDGSGYVIRSTKEKSRPRAVSAAEGIVRDHYRPAEPAASRMTWDELLTELDRHLRADGARPATIRDYLDTIRQARNAADLPSGLSVPAAQRWCNAYLAGTFSRKTGEGAKAYTRSPRTLHARVRKLKAMWGKYLVKRLKVATANPWKEVDLPKLDQLPVRTLTAGQVQTFFAWIKERWLGWELPTLFWEVKAVTGCRLGDLCSIPAWGLQDGKLIFDATTTKARRQRVAVLPPDLFAALQRIAGPKYLWERYAVEVAGYLERRDVPTHRVNPVFDPQRLAWWAKDEIDDFNKAHPDDPKIKSHDFRKRAVTEAHRAGLDVDTAAAAVGMSPATARGYYLAIDQEKASAILSERLADTLRPQPKPEGSGANSAETPAA